MDSSIIVCNSYGEKTLREIVDYWLSRKQKKDVQGISFLNNNHVIDSPVKSTSDVWSLYGLPELDLLPSILEKKGVMTLESSRGCMNACSFCPRKSKGSWRSVNYDNLEKIIPYISKIFDNYKNIPKKIFLVDEELFGDMDSYTTEKRLKRISKLFNKYQFRFESSARVNQIYSSSRNERWHIRRFHLLLYLKKNGLSKCLFGVESGVDSILLRFNKNTTSKERIGLISLCNQMWIDTNFAFDYFLKNMMKIKSDYVSGIIENFRYT